MSKHRATGILVLLLFLLYPCHIMAQVQKGYVKTRGRLGSNGAVIPGKGIENATIKVKDEGTFISDATGNFEINLRNEKYYLENVNKKGYMLVDADILSKQHTRSVDTFKIVLTTPEEQLEDELANERRLRRTLNRQLQQREDEIEALYETNKIIKAERDSALRKLYADHTDNEKLIKDMVEYYSLIDFDQLDDFNRRISDYILNGELTKADSMINSKGDIHARIERFRKHVEINKKERAELDEREKEAAKNEELTGKELEDIASDCYSKFEIFKLQHLNDSAAYYIELRASLDNSNIKWMLEAGDFISEYLADYEQAKCFYLSALNAAIAEFGENNRETANCYSHVAGVYSEQGDYNTALELYNKSLNVYSDIGENNINLSTVYNDMAFVFFTQGKYADALALFEKSSAIIVSVCGEIHPYVAINNSNIATVYYTKGDYEKALDLYERTLTIDVAIFGEQHPNVAVDYSNMASVHETLGEYSMALELYKKSLSIYLTFYGETHPYVAETYNNMAYTFNTQSEYSKALELYEKSLTIYSSVFGEAHPDVALVYNNIASVFYSQGKYSKTLEYSEKSLAIRIAFLGDSHPDVAKSYSMAAKACSGLGESLKALALYEKALGIFIPVFGEHHPDVAMCYNDMAKMYYIQDYLIDSLEYFEKSYEIIKDFLPSEHPDLLLIQKNIEKVKSRIANK